MVIGVKRAALINDQNWGLAIHRIPRQSKGPTGAQGGKKKGRFSSVL